MEIIIKEPIYLLLLLVIPIMIFLHYYFFEHIKKKAMKFSNFSAMKRVTGVTLITKNNSQLILRIIIFILLIISLSNPIIFLEKETSLSNYVIAIDSSASMLSDDVKPDRLTVAKEAASFFVDNLESKAKVAIISFTGISFIKSRLTDNKVDIKNAIKDINVELTGGTDIGGALVTAINILSNSEENKAKVIILISDGSDTAGVFIDESIDNALDYVKKNNVIVHTIGIGSGEGKGYIDLLPIYDSETLKKISETTGGNFYEVKSTSDITSAFKDLEIKKEKLKQPTELKNYIFISSLILLLFEWFLLNTKFRALP